ncbi:MAG: ROK family transcriptional regulator [Sphaerochaetaceae bacterium]
MNFSQPAAIRAINRLRVLNLVRKNERLSRADVAKTLELNKPSTGEIVQSLLDEGLLQEQEKVETLNGRRPTPLVLNKDGKLVIAVDMGSRNCSMAISDLKGNLLRFERFPTPLEPKPEELCYQVLKSVIRMSKTGTKQIAGAVVSMDAKTSEDKKTIEHQYSWNWTNLPLAEVFEHNIGAPTLLVNNVEAMVCGERWFANTLENSFLYVNWGQHISSALVYGEKIISADTMLGHVKVSKTGLCHCGDIGCLETIASGWALSEKFNNKTIKQLNEEKPEGFDSAMKTACSVLASILIEAVQICGCPTVILGGGISTIGSPYIDYLKDEFSCLLPARLSKVKIQVSPLGDKAGILGSVAVALDSFVFQQTFLDSLK